VTKIHWTDYQWFEERLEAFIAQAPDKDVVFLHAHGSPERCGVLRCPLDDVSFDGTNPIVFASSCLTGNYERWSDYGIAEAFFDRGVPVYIGSTELSPVTYNGVASKEFFRNWDADWSAGEAFAALERDLWSQDEWGWLHFWVWEYNLYGDPKFGAMSMEPEPQTPVSSLEVEVAIDIGLNNSGDAQDVILSAVVRRYSSSEVVDSLPLDSLTNLTGEASCSTQWDSSGFEAGYYCVEVSLEDAMGIRWIEEHKCLGWATC